MVNAINGHPPFVAATSKGLSVELSGDVSLEDLAPLWRRLDSQPGGSFFTAWPWIGTWLSLLPAAVPVHLLRLQRDGMCWGAAIAVRRDVRRHGIIAARGLHLNETGDADFDSLTIEHNGFAGLDPSDRGAWEALLRWFASGGAEADELSIPGVTCEIAGGVIDPPMLLSAKTQTAYRVDLARLRASGGKIGGILSANARQQLGRATRALAASGTLALEAAKSVGEAMAFFDGLKRLHVRSWTRRGQRHAFTSPFVERFHRVLIERCIASGEVELLRLAAGGKELGYLYNFCRNGHIYAYQSGFDDEDRRLRPGYVAHALAIERHGAAGAAAYDFMAGSNRLKESFATDRYAMHWYTIQRPLLRFRAEHAARAAKSRLKRSLGARD